MSSPSNALPSGLVGIQRPSGVSRRGTDDGRDAAVLVGKAHSTTIIRNLTNGMKKNPASQVGAPASRQRFTEYTTPMYMKGMASNVRARNSIGSVVMKR